MGGGDLVGSTVGGQKVIDTQQTIFPPNHILSTRFELVGEWASGVVSHSHTLAAGSLCRLCNAVDVRKPAGEPVSLASLRDKRRTYARFFSCRFFWTFFPPCFLCLFFAEGVLPPLSFYCFCPHLVLCVARSVSLRELHAPTADR